MQGQRDSNTAGRIIFQGSDDFYLHRILCEEGREACTSRSVRRCRTGLQVSVGSSPGYVCARAIAHGGGECLLGIRIQVWNGGIDAEIAVPRSVRKSAAASNQQGEGQQKRGDWAGESWSWQ